MSGREWKAGFIGLGGIGVQHMNNLSKMANVKIAAICDVNVHAMEREGDRFLLPAAKRYTEYRELLADPDVDFVISGVSNQYHYDILKVAIEEGKPIMSEKPFTRTLEEAEELMELYRKNPIPCMIGFSYRYRPCFQFVKKLIEQGALGRIRHIHAHYLQEENAPIFNKEYTWRFSKAMAGTGVLADIGSHMVDAARFFAGEFTQVTGLMNTFIEERFDPKTQQPVRVDVDDFTGFQGVLEGGVMATFYTHKNAIGTHNQFDVTVFGDLGTARISVEKPNEVSLTEREGKEMTLIEKTIHLDPPSMTTLLQDFVDYLENKGSSLVPTFVDGFRNQLVMQMIIDSAQDGITRKAGEYSYA